MKLVTKYIVPVILAIVLIFWAFKGIDFNVIFKIFKTADPIWVLAAFLFSFLAYILRGLRFKLMIDSLGYNASVPNVVSSVMIAYLVNLVFPRAGELARCVNLQKTENIPFEKSFGAVIAERIIDVFTLLIIVVLNVLIEYDKLRSFIEKFYPNFHISNNLIISAVIILVLSYWLLKKYWNTINAFIDHNNLLSKIKKMALGFKDGLLSVLKIKQLGLFVFYSFATWLCYYFLSLTLIKATEWGSMISYEGNLSVLVLGTFGMAVPSLGGLGSYHLLVSKILELYNFTAEQGLSIATFLHTYSGIIFVIFFGLLGFMYTYLRKKTTV